MLEAYFDESGIHAGAKYCVVVGLVGSVAQWQRFEHAWQKASRGQAFHAKDFFARVGGQRVTPYQDWTDDQARLYLDGLIDAIMSGPGRLTPVGAVVEVEAFRRLTLNERRYLTAGESSDGKFSTSGAPTKPYFTAFSHCIAASLRCIRTPGLKVSFIFDRQDQYASYATGVFQRLLSDGLPEIRDRLGELIFKDRASVGGLQAADLLAHVCYRRTLGQVGVNSEFDRAAERLTALPPHSIRLLDGKGIENFLSAVVPEDVRKAWRAG